MELSGCERADNDKNPKSGSLKAFEKYVGSPAGCKLRSTGAIDEECKKGNDNYDGVTEPDSESEDDDNTGGDNGNTGGDNGNNGGNNG